MFKKILIFGSLILVLALGLFGCMKKSTQVQSQSKNINQQVNQDQEKNYINFDYTIIGNHLSINGTTNIPDGAIIQIYVNRKADYEIAAYSDLTLDYQQILVKNGKFSYVIDLSEKSEFYQQDLKDNELIGNKLIKLYNVGTIFLLFDSINQPKYIYDTLGKHFEKLVTDQHNGSDNIIKTTKEFPLPNL